ncbi:MAG: hypothetical protein AAF423_00425 [Pseudomonadota bacterium]
MNEEKTRAFPSIVDRRTFVGGATAFFTFSAYAGTSINVTNELSFWLQSEIDEPNWVANPDVTGELPQQFLKILTEFADFVSRRWEIRDQFPDFANLLNSDFFSYKTTERDSYLTEYVKCTYMIDTLAKHTNTRDEAHEILAFWDVEKEFSIKSRLGRFRKFFRDEVAYFLLSQGGFRRFAELKNYKGYHGGSFTEIPPPYRVIDG